MDIYTIDNPIPIPSADMVETARKAIVSFVEDGGCKPEEYDIDALADILASKWAYGSGDAWDVICRSMESHRK